MIAKKARGEMMPEKEEGGPKERIEVRTVKAFVKARRARARRDAMEISREHNSHYAMLSELIDEESRTDHLHADAPRRTDAMINSILAGAWNGTWSEIENGPKINWKDWGDKTSRREIMGGWLLEGGPEYVRRTREHIFGTPVISWEMLLRHYNKTVHFIALLQGYDEAVILRSFLAKKKPARVGSETKFCAASAKWLYGGSWEGGW